MICFCLSINLISQPIGAIVEKTPFLLLIIVLFFTLACAISYEGISFGKNEVVNHIYELTETASATGYKPITSSNSVISDNLADEPEATGNTHRRCATACCRASGSIGISCAFRLSIKLHILYFWSQPHLQLVSLKSVDSHNTLFPICCW